MLQEVYVFLSAVGSGVITGFIYDLFRMKRKALKTRSFMVGLEDILFWILTTILVFITAYISNEGEIRLYFFLSALLGVIVYYWLFSRWVSQILTFVIKILIWPFAQIILFLKPPIMWLCKLIGKGAKKTGNKFINYRKKAGRRFKSIRNIVRKI